MADIQELRKFLEEKYDIITEGELLKAMEKIGPIHIGVFTSPIRKGKSQ